MVFVHGCHAPPTEPCKKRSNAGWRVGAATRGLGVRGIGRRVQGFGASFVGRAGAETTEAAGLLVFVCTSHPGMKDLDTGHRSEGKRHYSSQANSRMQTLEGPAVAAVAAVAAAVAVAAAATTVADVAVVASSPSACCNSEGIPAQKRSECSERSVTCEPRPVVRPGMPLNLA